MKKFFIIFSILISLGLVALSIAYKLHTKPSIDSGNPMKTFHVTYSCDEGKTIDISSQPKEKEDGDVTIYLSDGRLMTLTQTISTYGTRYANTDESFVFWSKDNSALVLEDNEEKSYIGCILVAPIPEESGLARIYSNSSLGFSIRYPYGYPEDATYQHHLLGGQTSFGIKFTLPYELRVRTNVSDDTSISIESLSQASSCSADLFFDTPVEATQVTIGNTTYSTAFLSDAAAGNRYEETVYALPGTTPCFAVRYFIHYSVFENYEPGTIEEFDKEALINTFNQIRDTLIINQ